MMVEGLVSEVLTNEDCFGCQKKCCIYLFTDGIGPVIQPYELPRVLDAILNAREDIIHKMTNRRFKLYEMAEVKFERFVRRILLEGMIPPIPLVIDGSPENVCGAYSLEKGECLIYHDRPESCKIHPAYEDEKGIVRVDTACPAHEKVGSYLRAHGINIKLSNFLEGNLEIRRKERNY